MIGRAGGDDWQNGQYGTERQHGLEPFADGDDAIHFADADAVAVDQPQRASRRRDRRLRHAGRVEPGAMRAGNVAREVGGSGDQCRPGVAGGVRRVVLVTPVVAARMETQRRAVPQILNTAIAQIRFCDRAADRLGHGEQAAGCLWRPLRRGRDWLAQFGTRQAQEASGLVEGDGQRRAVLRLSDKIEQVAMFAPSRRRSIYPPILGRSPSVGPSSSGRGCCGCRPRSTTAPRGVRWADSAGRRRRRRRRACGPGRMRYWASLAFRKQKRARRRRRAPEWLQVRRHSAAIAWGSNATSCSSVTSPAARELSRGGGDLLLTRPARRRPHLLTKPTPRPQPVRRRSPPFLRRGTLRRRPVPLRCRRPW